MATLTIHTKPWLVDPRAPIRVGPFYAGEVLPAGSACYLKSDGKIWLTYATAAVPGPNVASKFDGICIEGAAAVGDPVTLFGLGAIIDLSDSMTIGTFYYAAAIGSKGLLDDTAGGVVTTVQEIPLCMAYSATAVLVVRSCPIH
jgi:hypothetical protein